MYAFFVLAYVNSKTGLQLVSVLTAVVHCRLPFGLAQSLATDSAVLG